MALRGALLTGAVVWAAVIPLAAYAATRPGGVPAAYGFALAVYSMGRVIVAPVRAGGSGSMPSATAARRVLIGALLPTVVTLVFEWTTGTMPANWVRALAGFPIGAAAAWLIASAGAERSERSEWSERS